MGRNTRKTQSGGRKRRWAFRIVLLVAVLCLFTGAGLWTTTRSWFICWRTEPVLERLLGGDVTIRAAEHHGSGLLVFHDLTVSVHGLNGAPAEICAIRELRVRLSLSELLGGRGQSERGGAARSGAAPE